MRALIFGLLMTWSSFGFTQTIPDLVNELEDLKIVNIDGVQVLAAANGLSVYTFDNDTPNNSNCFDGCLNTWPAVITSADTLPEPFSIHIRPDGAKQIVLNGSPLYFFRGDAAQGDINGDGIGGVWHLITQ